MPEIENMGIQNKYTKAPGKIFVFLTLVSICLSCNINRPCDEQIRFPVNTGFYYISDEEVKDTILEDITVFGIGREDSLLYDRDTTNAISYRLSPYVNATEIVIVFGSLYDTLTFDYSRELRMVSPECGFAFLFDIRELSNTSNFIDSISLIDPKLEEIETEHLKIFIY